MLESRSGADITPGSMVEALRRKDFAIIFDWFAVCFFWGAIVCILLTAASASLVKGFYEGVRITALATILAGACTVCGWLLGLLFGIPRTLSRPAQAPTTTNQPSGSDPKTTASTVTSRVNTNLEDVSDWLTKTLVGVDLTQLCFVPVPKSTGAPLSSIIVWTPPVTPEQIIRARGRSSGTRTGSSFDCSSLDLAQSPFAVTHPLRMRPGVREKAMSALCAHGRQNQSNSLAAINRIRCSSRLIRWSGRTLLEMLPQNLLPS